MAKRISLILIALFFTCFLAQKVSAYGGEKYPAPGGPTVVTASIGTSDTTVTSSATGYWFIKPEQDMYVNFGAAATTGHVLLDAGVWIKLFPVRIHAGSSSRTPNSVHFLAKTTTGNITGWVVPQ